MTSTLRTGSGRQFRSPGLHETPLPFAQDAAIMPGSRLLGDDGQIYESMKDWVTGLYEWKVRAQGEPGPALELQKSSTHLQYRVQGSTGAWTDLVLLADLLGPKGDEGDQGPQGAGLSFQGSVATVADLPSPSTLGYGYLVTATSPPHLYLYNGTTWVDAGPIQGPKGDPGSEVELQKTATEIQWRRVGAASWNTLVQLADIKGDAGTSVELRKTSTEIQWRLIGAASWNTLVALDDIKGPVGDDGQPGATGPGFSYQGSVATVADLPSPSTQGYGLKVIATGDLHIYNGSAWVNAGPLQGPKGDKGDQGDQGDIGPGFSYQGAVATVADLPTPSTQGYAYKVTATGNLHIYNGTTWVNAGPLQGPKGDQGDQGNTGPGFSYRGTVPTVADLPSPSTQGYAYKVIATGDIHIYNGTDWVNAGPLQGPKGDKGDAATVSVGTVTSGSSASVTNSGTAGAAVFNFTIPKGDKGDPGEGTAATISVGTVTTGAAGSAASVTNSGTSSAAVFDFSIPKGDKGNNGNDGNAATISVGTVTTGAAGSSASISNSGTSSAAVFNFTIPKGDKGDKGNDGGPGVAAATAPLSLDTTTNTLSISAATTTAAGSMSAADKTKLDGIATGATALTSTSTPQFAGLGLGTAAVSGWELTVAGGMCTNRQSVTAQGSTIYLDVQQANEFVAGTAISGNMLLYLSGLTTIPTGYVWRGVFSFTYNSGTISWFTSNSGWTVSWDGNVAMIPTSGEVETVIITAVPSLTKIEIAALKGRT